MGIFRRIAGIFGRRYQSSPGLPGFVTMPSVEDLPTDTDAQKVVQEICQEAIAAKQGWQVKLSDSARWAALKNDDGQLQIAVALAAVVRRPSGSFAYSGSSWEVEQLRNSIVSQLVRRNLPFQAPHLRSLLTAWLAQNYLEYGIPGKTILGAVERHAQQQPLDQDIKKLLGKLRDRALDGRTRNKFHQQIADRVSELLDPIGASTKGLPAGPFATEFSQWAAGLPAQGRENWLALAQFAAEAGDKSKPSGKWLARAEPVIEQVGVVPLTGRIIELLEATTPDPARPDDSLDILKGMLWLSTFTDRSELAGPVGRFAEKCFRKVPQVGARSVKLGNAALWALSEMAGEPRAAAELFRLKEKIKYPSARKVIESRLGELAVKTGQTVEAMEDVSLPDFGLDQASTLHFSFGDARAELRLLATETSQHWFGSGGKPLKSVPAEAKTRAGELAAFKLAAKEIETARAAQVLRLEQSWIEQRNWTFADWQEHFLRHPLRRPIVESLIWRIGDQAAMPQDGELRDIDGRFLDPPADAVVRLWHPLDSQPEAVLAWRRRIMDLGLTQPIKQAHREIYVLTDAERQTGVYSNRFAAHILRQHQFRALCQARGWKYDLMGGWDGWNIPSRPLPAQKLLVEYHVDVVDDDQRSDAWVSLHVASDQVRFLDEHRQPVELEGIAPIIFSEVLRDVDLFVAVTSVANDPGWTDGGPDGRHGNYWREWAFGDLGQSATTRKELISWIAPKLSIADKLEIGDKSLIVQGKRQQYAIHFGSGNIQILPSNRYLCIVPDRAPAEAANIRLPFAGDGTLSTILSKAFLLVDEDKIKDATILRQL